MVKVLIQKFFERSAFEVAPDLLGKYLVRRLEGKNVGLMINEVEVYEGHDDKASHASRGKTKRNEVMFGMAGIFYIYFTYGMHYMLNVVCADAGFPSAILIRGANGLSGPAILTKKLAINKSLNKMPASKSSGLWFEDRGIVIKFDQILKTKRIGVNYAKDWADKLFRFSIKELDKCKNC